MAGIIKTGVSHLKQLFILFLILCAPTAHAGEVDNYYALEKDIEDSSPLFNTYLNTKVQKTLDDVNKNEAYLVEDACEDVALEIIDALGATWYLFYHSGALNTDMELWAEKNAAIDRVPGFSENLNDYYSQSIYAPGMAYFGIWPTVIDVTMNVGGIYFGTDKISHFLGSGYEYYKIYLETREKTGSEIQAHFEAIRWGIGMENSILGIRSVTVFSYADLEANYQGLMMTIGFCQGDHPDISFDGSKWVLENPIDFREYVNPNWDETFNVSTYTDSRLKNVRKNLAELKLCDKLDSQWVKSRFSDYRKTKESFTEKGFLDTSLSVRLLKLSQRYQFEDLSQQGFEQFAEKFHPGFTYNELKSFNEDLKIMNQNLYILEHLCKPKLSVQNF